MPKMNEFPATRWSHPKLRSQTPRRFRLFLNVSAAPQLATATTMLVPQCPRWRTLFSTHLFTTTIVSPALHVTYYTKITQKKRKSFDKELETPKSPAAEESLSPQQLDRIARNKRAALERLTSAQTPPGFGDSWKVGLSAEFGKPYFKQVRTATPPPTSKALRLCCVQKLKSWLVVFAVGELRRRREEETHSLPSCRARLYLDSDV